MPPMKSVILRKEEAISTFMEARKWTFQENLDKIWPLHQEMRLMNKSSPKRPKEEAYRS